VGRGIEREAYYGIRSRVGKKIRSHTVREKEVAKDMRGEE
jgi:hypothetical protein